MLKEPIGKGNRLECDSVYGQTSTRDYFCLGWILHTFIFLEVTIKTKRPCKPSKNNVLETFIFMVEMTNFFS